MRASTLLVFVLAAVSSPAYGAPLRNTFCDQHPSACIHVVQARQADSEAISWSSVWNAAKDVFSIGKSTYDVASAVSSSNSQQQQQRDFVDFDALMARADDDDSGALAIGKILKGVAAVAPALAGAASYLFHDSGNSTQSRREFEELIARTDDSEALALGKILKGVAAVAPALAGAASYLFHSDSGNGTQSRRDFEELFARADVASGAVVGDEDSGALSLKDFLNDDHNKYIFNSIEDRSSNSQQQRRELVEMIARQAVDDSGAFSLKGILNVGKDIFNGVEDIFGGSSNSQQQQQRREFAELLTRTAANDQTGSLGLDTIFKIGKAAFTGIKDLVDGSSSSNQQQSREFVELLARSDEGAELLRRLNFTPVNKTPVNRVQNFGPGLLRIPQLYSAQQSARGFDLD